jgi:hypothetical protein
LSYDLEDPPHLFTIERARTCPAVGFIQSAGTAVMVVADAPATGSVEVMPIT